MNGSIIDSEAENSQKKEGKKKKKKEKVAAEERFRWIVAGGLAMKTQTNNVLA